MRLEVIHESIGSEEHCVYLPSERSQMRYRFVERCSAATYEKMLVRGWRRFGQVFFRPMCASCHQCRSLRLEVRDFRPNRSMRRNLARNQDLEVVVQPASLTFEHLALYDRYHNDMSGRKGWRDKWISPLEYFRTFVEGHQTFGPEILYLLEGRLVGVALVDILPSAVSAVYCFYEPGERARGIGVFSVLQQLELARARAIPFVYLGYWIAGNPSMRYKSNYRPHQLLAGRPGFNDQPSWPEVDGRRE